MKVLLVEDYAPIRERLCELVRTVPGAHIVAEADEPSLAVAAIEQNEPAVVIIDLQLKAGTSGLTILKWVREHRPAIAVIVLSNSAYAQMRKVCLELGAKLFLDKASEFVQLRAALVELTRY
ncbi:response regulator [Trinickia sp. NRRL B-1857]|uniref:response regulator n=1 Tax=Trinickia sp. NRRL B-1857 TaxID=3162879 RepID=UPI003D2A9D0D